MIGAFVPSWKCHCERGQSRLLCFSRYTESDLDWVLRKTTWTGWLFILSGTVRNAVESSSQCRDYISSICLHVKTALSTTRMAIQCVGSPDRVSNQELTFDDLPNVNCERNLLSAREERPRIRCAVEVRCSIAPCALDVANHPRGTSTIFPKYGQYISQIERPCAVTTAIKNSHEGRGCGRVEAGISRGA